MQILEAQLNSTMMETLNDLMHKKSAITEISEIQGSSSETLTNALVNWNPHPEPRTDRGIIGAYKYFCLGSVPRGW